MNRNISPSNITRLGPNEIFTYGSNEAGVHGCGAAAYARTHFGAQMGVGIGPTGQCYALPTKDQRIETLSLGAILVHVQDFLRYAVEHPEQKFLVTAIGTGLAGLAAREIAPMFFHSPDGWVKLPPNVFLPEPFWLAMKEFPDFTLYDDVPEEHPEDGNEEAGLLG